MIRETFIERTLRQIYGGQPNDDSNITYGLVNSWLNDAIALAAKQNYKESLAIDGIAYVNNSFYTTFKNLSVAADDQFTWKITLPEIPIGIGANEGVSTVKFKDDTSKQISFPLVWLTQNQLGYYQSMRPIPNKLIAYSEGEFLYVKSTLLLNLYTAHVTMISGGDSTNLDSTLNVPPDYFPVMVEYIKQQLQFERLQPVDDTNDGRDAVKSV